MITRLHSIMQHGTLHFFIIKSVATLPCKIYGSFSTDGASGLSFYITNIEYCRTVYPVTLPITLHPNPFRKKIKIVVVLFPNVMYCNEFFLDICHRLCTYCNLLMTVSALALALHMLLFVPPCLFPLHVCINICVLLFV